MQQIHSTERSKIHAPSRAVAAANDQHALLRGLTYGIIFSMALWVTAGYLTFGLR